MRTPKIDKRRLPLSPETKAKISAALKRHPVSAETRAKMSAAAKGNRNGAGKRSKEARKNMANGHKKRTHYAKGFKRSAEWCAQTSARMKGNKNKLGYRDSRETRELKRAATLAHLGRVVMVRAPGLAGFVPDYRAERVLFFKP